MKSDFDSNALRGGGKMKNLAIDYALKAEHSKISSGGDVLDTDFGILRKKIGFQRQSSCKLHCPIELKDVLQKMEDFSGVKPRTFEHILNIAHIKQYPRNSVIAYNGDNCEVLYYLFHGSVKVFKYNKHGKEAITNIYLSECAMKNEPPLINYGAFIDTIARNTIQALEPCRVLTLQIGAFRELLKSDVILANNFLNRTNSALNELNYFIELSLLDSRARVISILERNPHILANVSKKLIASLLNISQETLSRILQELEAEMGANYLESHKIAQS